MAYIDLLVQYAWVCIMSLSMHVNLDSPSESELEHFFTEGAIMREFHHPNVLGLMGVVFDTPDGVPYLVLPFMKNGNLKDYLKSRRVEVSDFDTLPQVG